MKIKKNKRGSKDIIKNYINIYVGHSEDDSVRINASSGGIVKEIFKYLLSTKKVDGVMIVVQKYPKFFTKIAKTIDDLSEMENSVYAPVNYSKGIKEMEEGKKYAVTGIGCQDMMLEKVNHLIKFKIGFLCRGTYLESTMQSYASALGHDSIKKFNFRTNGWPGEINIADNKGEHYYPRRPSFIKFPKLISTKEAFFSKATYLPKCRPCKYEFSFPSCDISLGDAWHNKYIKDKKGLTLAITRSSLGEQLLTTLKNEKKIKIWKEDYQETNEVMDDPNIVKYFTIKKFLYENKILRFLLPYLVFLELYIFNFPIKLAFKRLFTIRNKDL